MSYKKLKYTLEETEEVKKLVSDNYNYIYNKLTQTLLRWGTSFQDNPTYAPFGPETLIVDVQDMSMELFTVVLNTINTNRTLVNVNLLHADLEAHKGHILYCHNGGLYPAFPNSIESPTEAGFFSLYVSNTGLIKPSSTYNESINIMDVNNFYLGIWEHPLFKKYRWEELQRRA